jgi:hypothetical protein
MTHPTSSVDALSHAHRLLDKLPLVDGHNDLPFVIRRDRDAKGDVRRYDLNRVHQNTDTDIPRLKEGRLSAQSARPNGKARSPPSSPSRAASDWRTAFRRFACGMRQARA